MAIWQNSRRRISDKAPAVGRALFGPGVFDRIVNRTQVSKCILAIVIFTAFNDEPAVWQHSRSKGIGHVSRGQAGNALPSPVEVASKLVGSELGPIGFAVALGYYGSIRHQKANANAVRRLVNEGLQRLS